MQSTVLNYCDLGTWKVTLGEMTEVLQVFEELAPEVFAGFVIRDWHKQPLLFQPDQELTYLKDLRGDFLAKLTDRNSKHLNDPNSTPYDQGHIGRVQEKYLGNFCISGDFYNPFTTFIEAGLREQLQKLNKKCRELLFISRLESDTKIDQTNLFKAKNSCFIISESNKPTKINR